MRHSEFVRRFCAVVAVALFALFVSACGVYQARTRGEQATAHLHEQLNSSQYSDIYEGASPEFKRTVTREQWTDVCAQMRARLGRWKTSELKDGPSDGTGVYIVDSGGYMVILNYTATFELGSAAETVRFAVKDNTIGLLSYAVSPIARR